MSSSSRASSPVVAMAISIAFVAFAFGCTGAHAAGPSVEAISVQPAELVLHGSRDTQRVQVTGRHGGSQLESDLTSLARYESLDPAVASVTAEGMVSPRGHGPDHAGGPVRRSRAAGSRAGRGFRPETADRLPDRGHRGARTRRLQPGCLPRFPSRKRRLPAQLAGVRPRARLPDLDPRNVRATDRRLRVFREPRAEEGHDPGAPSRRTTIPPRTTRPTRRSTTGSCKGVAPRRRRDCRAASRSCPHDETSTPPARSKGSWSAPASTTVRSGTSPTSPCSARATRPMPR